MSFAKDQLLPDETLIAITRQHPLVLSRAILLNFLSAAVFLGLSYATGRYWILLCQLVPSAFLVWKILDRQRKEYIITDRRVVKHEGILSVTSFDAPLDKINNVFHEQSFFGRILKYGDVGLETASEQGTTIFHFITDPIRFKNCIVRHQEARRASVAPPAPASRQSIPQLLEELASLRDRNIITAQEFERKKKALLDRI
jgi:uncharacterized membrane protein YdbT with pleckstrin-like domain